ncbi:carboxymuconolactone decarboxylase family protein [Gordonia humi]|uniref:Alkylhydroperoxidase family enzyme n=1 Tax=Gordonia humi TaxID=686429 RepID=A0A840ESM8_9ACTN|nr:carboxymuconolactone decarboxylase family protein [Gordonia humi]MBB4134692.1 alkylhydroperoxidase family enzyme [Gordonia humi]
MSDTASQRIPAVTDPSPEVAETLAKTLVGPDGQAFAVFRTLANHPRLLKRFNVLGGMFLAHGLLPERDREIVILRTAWRTDSVYEWGQHVLIGREAGVTDDEIARLATAPVNGWSNRDARLLTFTDELLADVDVSETTWNAVAEFLDRDEIIELTMLVGLYRMLAGFLNAARVTPEEHLPGWPET